jgi:hypothetical protein
MAEQDFPRTLLAVASMLKSGVTEAQRGGEEDMMPTCFVVQGFGKKTDFESGRTLDLDASYAVIKEAVEAVPGFSCVRADEIVHAGHIEMAMYQQLLGADLVIVDLSTSNVNAFYELGVRFALRPRATIVVAEDRITFPFNIGHIKIHTYRHLGTDLGYQEANRLKADLIELIQALMNSDKTDSPVYTFFPDLKKPSRPAKQTIAPPPQGEGVSLNQLKRQARQAMDDSKFEKAIPLWEQVRDEGPKDDYVVQQLALATYKSKKPTEEEALKNARGILDNLWPRESLDPETLGLWAAVHKRLYELNGDAAALEEAITATEKGFVLRRDYYNGINLAFLLDRRAADADPDVAAEDHARARSVRRRVTDVCRSELEQKPEMNEQDRYWVLATLQEASVGLGDDAAAEEWGRQAQELASAAWMIESTQGQLAKLGGLLAEIDAKLQ